MWSVSSCSKQLISRFASLTYKRLPVFILLFCKLTPTLSTAYVSDTEELLGPKQGKDSQLFYNPDKEDLMHHQSLSLIVAAKTPKQ